MNYPLIVYKQVEIVYHTLTFDHTITRLYSELDLSTPLVRVASFQPKETLSTTIQPFVCNQLFLR